MQKRLRHELIIIGGGAAGLFLAANLKKSALILEQNEKIAKKLLISGGGKCNITNENISPDAYLCDDYELLEKTLNAFSYKDNLKFFKNIDFVKIRNKQFFAPSSRLVLNDLLSKINSQIYLNTKAFEVLKEDGGYLIKTNRGEFFTKHLVIASGGLSFAELGVSDIALNIAKSLNIKSFDFAPALVPLTLQKNEFFMKNLSGTSIDVVINKRFSGSLLFTHKSLSGPVVLSASLFWNKGTLIIDFLKDFKLDFSSKKQASTHLPLPKNFTKEYLKSLGLEDLPMNRFKERAALEKLFAYELAPAGTLGFKKAEVSRGGVHLGALDENYQAREHKGLYFIGECVNATGILGGFNIHFAFASAKKLANYLNKELL